MAAQFFSSCIVFVAADFEEKKQETFNILLTCRQDFFKIPAGLSANCVHLVYIDYGIILKNFQ
jgi:hypothetical protein